MRGGLIRLVVGVVLDGDWVVLAIVMVVEAVAMEAAVEVVEAIVVVVREY